MSDVFKTLSKVDVSKHIEKKNGLSYLSWAWAWQYVKELYPDANYIDVKFDGKPYLYDENLGYMVSTEVTIQGETIPMSLPVMDNSNKAMKAVSYKYKTRSGERSVEAATMFDINNARMRCLVKNLAMFGLGLYIYSGEDLPVTTVVEKLDEKGVKTLKEFIESKGYTVEQICQSYNINSLSDFDASMAKPVCEQVNAWAKTAQQ